MHLTRLLRLLGLGLLLLLPACRRAGTGVDAGGPRIVSLAPNLTEIVCAVGGRDLLVGRTTACNYPPEALGDVPAIGGFGVPSMELLVAAAPTLILDVDLEDEALSQKFQALGLRRERIACRTLDDIPAAIRQIGELCERPAQADTLAAALESDIARLRRQSAQTARRPTVYVEIWNDPMTTVGRDTFLSELVALAGGQNIGDETAREYFQASAEWVLSRNPDVILCLYMSEHRAPGRLLSERPGWQRVAAVTHHAVCDGFNNDVLLRPGPRVIEGVEALRRCLTSGPSP